jgi:thiamine-monophosphate kinase
MTRQTVRDAGEFGLIDRIHAALPEDVRTSSALAIGIGDDTSVWTPPQGEQLLITTDALIEGVHFDLAWHDWRSLGWKSLAVNVSDIAAMGGQPALAEIALGLPADTLVDDVLAFYQGMADLAGPLSVVIAGGDIVGSPTAVMVNVTVIGHTVGGRFLTRSGAKPGDLIAVSGTLGAAAAGLRLLQLPEDNARRRATTAGALIDALLHPVPRVALHQALLAHGATAAMDLSDGLLGDLPKILAMSQVAATVTIDSVPVAASVRALFPDDWQQMALRGGEDYELLFTAPESQIAAIVAAAESMGQMVTVIGRIEAQAGDHDTLRLLGSSGEPVHLPQHAFEHFGAG